MITATQMLESMVNNPSPTRAEVTDVANAIFDGTDAVMLSEETAVGKFPVECVRTLDNVSLLAEERMRSIKKSIKFDLGFDNDVAEVISSAVATISIRIRAEAIVTKLDPFDMVSKISRRRPNAPIVAVSDEESSIRRSKIMWGVYPFRAIKSNSAQNILRSVVGKLIQEKLLSGKEKVLLISETQESSGRSSVALQVVQSAMRRSAA
ncbi:MAG TPA: pyruvate kinase [Nitrososphaerales archaeon]|nr:pyruvate kinase [Nitrososphaerales archaeon]